MSSTVIFLLIACVVTLPASLLPTNRGNKCYRASDADEGVCLALNECFEIPQNIFTKNESLCGIDKQTPMVCCALKSSDQSADVALALAYTAAPSGPHKTDIPVSEQKCQEYAKFVYVGEEDKSERCTIMVEKKIGLAVLGEFPHMASLQYENLRKNTTTHMCGGSLISEKFVLTAAHCIANIQIYNYRITGVALGAVDLSKNSKNRPQFIPVAQVIPHPDFNIYKQQFDIGLVKLARAPILGPFLRPACLPRKDEEFSSRPHVLTGWGKTKTGQASETLTKVVLYETTSSRCQNAYPSVKVNNESSICVGHPTSKSNSCAGDSGGPLQVFSLEAHCMYTVAAVVAYGGRNCSSGEPGVYSRVQYFRRWIENIVWD